MGKRADEYFDAKEYTMGLEAYAKAYSKEKSRDQKQRISYNMAECYRFTGQCKRAASYYLRAQKLGFGALSGLGYAEMLQCQGEYEDAIVAFEEYKKLIPSDSRAETGILSFEGNWPLLLYQLTVSHQRHNRALQSLLWL